MSVSVKKGEKSGSCGFRRAVAWRIVDVRGPMDLDGSINQDADSKGEGVCLGGKGGIFKLWGGRQWEG